MIHEIVLTDCLDRVEPPEHALTLRVIDDTVFVIVEKRSGPDDKSTVKKVFEIAVSLPALQESLALLDADDKRERLRPLDPLGNVTGDRGTSLK